jgi:hypothetical protein
VKPVSFVVPSVKKNLINLEVIEAMKERQVEISAYRVKDRRGIVRYLGSVPVTAIEFSSRL